MPKKGGKKQPSTMSTLVEELMRMLVEHEMEFIWREREVHYRVESGSDDLDNVGHLGHILMGQAGLIHKLNYLYVTRIF